jgi:hypothetical protein
LPFIKTIVGGSAKQDDLIYQLNHDLEAANSKYLNDLGGVIDGLTSNFDVTRQDVQTFVQIVDDAKCKY